MNNSISEENNYDDLTSFLGIQDENSSILFTEDTNVFSTSVFIPMENTISFKTFFYFSGMIKLIETFKTRIENPPLKDTKWMLFIYYDAMLNDEYDPTKYNNQQGNNNLNRTVKQNFKQNQVLLLKLHSLYREYISKIKENEGGKYDFVKLYSFDCSSITKKANGYMGHPATFGSIVRFLPLFNPLISRVYCINISHAISPNLCYLINYWIETDAIMVTAGNNSYKYQFDKPNFDESIDILDSIYKPGEKFGITIKNENGFRQYILFYPIPAGMFGFYKKSNLLTNANLYFFSEEDNNLEKKQKKINPNVNLFYRALVKLVETFNDAKIIDTKNIFFYGIDETLLSFIFHHLKTRESKLNYYDIRKLVEPEKTEKSKNLDSFTEDKQLILFYTMFKQDGKIYHPTENSEQLSETHRFYSRSLYQVNGIHPDFINELEKIKEDVNLRKAEYNDNKSAMKDIPAIAIQKFYTILNSYDEEKPLLILDSDNDGIIFSTNSVNIKTKLDTSTEYYTLINYNQPELVSELIKYYTDTTKVLPLPYYNGQSAGSKKYLYTHKKTKHKKTKHKTTKHKTTKHKTMKHKTTKHKNKNK
jgi:hypothetical protein